MVFGTWIFILNISPSARSSVIRLKYLTQISYLTQAQHFFPMFVDFVIRKLDSVTTRQYLLTSVWEREKIDD